MSNKIGNFLNNKKSLTINDPKINWKFLTIIGVIILFFALAIVVPLEAMITLSAARNLEIQNKNSAIETAMTNNNYAAWNSLVTDQNLKSKVNAGNFAQFVVNHRLLQQGKVVEADPIKKALLFKEDFAETSAKSQAIQNAINNGKYNDWRVEVGPDVLPGVNSTNFTTYASGYQLAVAGNFIAANKIFRALTIKPGYTEMYSSGR